MISRIPILDGLRAISIILVLLSHQEYSGASVKPNNWLFHQGDLGVRIFFVISGFLICTILTDEYIVESRIRLSNFYLKRVFRLFPVYLSYTLLVILADIGGVYEDAFSSYLGVFTYARNIVGRGQSLTVHFWSLSVEEQFYVVLPLLLLILLKSWGKRECASVFFFLAILAIAFRCNQIHTDTIVGQILGAKSIFRYMDSLFVGCMIAILSPRWTLLSRPLVCFSKIACWVAVCLASIFGGGRFSPFAPFVQALSIGGYIGLAASMPSKLEMAVWDNKAISYIGTLSYSLYVWHVLFLDHFNKGMFDSVWLDEYWYFWAFCIGILSYHGLERPMRGFLTRRYVRT